MVTGRSNYEAFQKFYDSNINLLGLEKTTYEVDTFFPEFKNYFLDKNKEDTYIWKLYKNKNGQWHEVVV